MSATVLPLASPSSLSRKIFLGPHGLRAGWSLAVFGALMFAIIAAIHFSAPVVIRRLHPSGAAVNTAPRASDGKARETPASHDIPQEVLLLFAAFLSTWTVSRIEKRPMAQYGLGGNARRWPQLAQGLFWGFAFLSALIGGLALTHAIVFDGRQLFHFAVYKYALLWLCFFSLVGLFEEYVFRGYLQFTLARGIGNGAVGFWISALLWNCLFGLAHGTNAGESHVGLFAAGFFGFVMCLSLWYTRSLWWAIGFHATWDWGESYFYGTADSGTLSRGHLYATHPKGAILLSRGATGPEGSVLALAAVACVAAVIWLTLHRERDRSTNQALVNPPLTNPLVTGLSS